jgi:2-polyprenyl-6-hydroxyphenyl methylase/3-demethylubiquinone-9 3-methyltransferase
MKMETGAKFSFGDNWESFSTRSLNAERLEQARRDFAELFTGISLRGKSFLDIGFGQGLALMLAAEQGACAFGIDLDPQCERALRATAKFFPQMAVPPFEIASILDDAWVETQCARGGFEIVHSWGVLHHTGNMARAFQNAARLVKPQGYLVIAIYNRHWTAPVWRFIKRMFASGSPRVQAWMLQCMAGPMALRVRMLSRNPDAKNRGMEFQHDLRDWLGGYPYEYASRAQVENVFVSLGFQGLRVLPTHGWTGCNQFVFRRTR